MDAPAERVPTPIFCEYGRSMLLVAPSASVLPETAGLPETVNVQPENKHTPPPIALATLPEIFPPFSVNVALE